MPVTHAIGLGVSWLRTCLGLLWRAEGKLKGVHFEGAVRFEGRPIISVAPGSRMTIGDGVRINSAARSNPLACFQPSVLRTLAPGAELILGDASGLSGAVICAGSSVRIGHGTIIGSGAMILDNDFHSFVEGQGWVTEHARNARPIVIGENVFIGARAIILKGVTLGNRSVIGAGAVVTQDVPDGALAGGNPARVVQPKASK